MTLIEVEWTKATGTLKNKEYRYLSPVVMVRKERSENGTPSVALTNTVIDGMFPGELLTIEDYSEGGTTMDLKEIIKALGASGDPQPKRRSRKAVEEAGKAAQKIKEMEEKGDGGTDKGGDAPAEVVANSTILKLLELDENAKTEDVAASIMALKTGGDKVTAATVLALKEKIERKESG